MDQVELPSLSHWAERAREILKNAEPGFFVTTDDLPGMQRMMTTEQAAILELEEEMYSTISKLTSFHYARQADFLQGDSYMSIARSLIQEVRKDGS